MAHDIFKPKDGPIKVVFFGTSDFAVPSLEALFRDPRFSIELVVTQPDRPVGRHARLTPPPVKQKVESLGFKPPIKQYEDVRKPEALSDLQTIKADVGVVISFGQIIPQALIDHFPFGIINLHGSLLPKYRGSSPIQAAIVNGDTESGVSVMLIDQKMDHGPLLASFTCPVEPTDHAGQLHDRLAKLGSEHLTDTIFDYVTGDLKPIPQDESKATVVKLLKRENGQLDLTKQAAIQAERLVRAYDPWPGTSIELEGRRIKLLDVKVGPTSIEPVGSRVKIENEPGIVCADQTVLILTKLQPEGKTAMTGQAFLSGNVW